MRDLNALALPDLLDELVHADDFERLLDAAWSEDVGERGDVTSRSIIDQGRGGSFVLAARSAGIVAGLPLVARVLERFDPAIRFEALAADGDRCQPDQCLGRGRGSLRSILVAERTLLNLLGHLCGIATATRGFVDAIAEASAVICDTRKTTPGWRGLEKYAVRCGGATLHRVGLYDAALYKDNHLAHIPIERLGAALAAAVRAARESGPLRFVEVEVDTLDQLDVVLDLPRELIDLVLLDNMNLDQLRAAVDRRDAARSRVQLEASGGVTLATVAGIAATGVDRISVGAVTHSAGSLDVGLDVRDSVQ